MTHPVTGRLPDPSEDSFAGVLRDGLRSVYQPIVDLASGDVVAYESLVRGPTGPLEMPQALFAAARAAGMLADLDQNCRVAALSGAEELGLVAPLTLFVNVEPEVLDDAPLVRMSTLAASMPRQMRVVLEITERALAQRPAELLRTVDRVRELGWGIALDDVGVDASSLAFMSLLCPDVVKLDLSLVQSRPSLATAEITNAVNAYTERSGALVVAEGIETAEHAKRARAMGADLGQGWFFGRPTRERPPSATTPGLSLPSTVRSPVSPVPTSPFTYLPPQVRVRVRETTKPLLLELSMQLERQAMRLGESCLVVTAFQKREHLTPASMQRYRELVERVGFVYALGEEMPDGPVPGVTGAALDPDDPIRHEWDVVVLSAHFSAVLLARDTREARTEPDREFEYVLTYDRQTAVSAAHELLKRVAPRPVEIVPEVVVPRPRAPLDVSPLEQSLGLSLDGDALLRRALGATTNGVTVADMTQPDAPLIFVNSGFARLAGMATEELTGRNCRLLQGPDTDPASVRRMRDALAAGVEWQETLLNYRGPERIPWWNEVHLSPILDHSGRVVLYVGVQHDVTDRVEAERALLLERDRARSYLTRIEQLAFTDPLTGLMNRRRFESRLEEALREARLRDRAVALMFFDLDGFKAVNDARGHGVGDDLLRLTAQRLQARIRGTDLLARLGGDEFLVALTDLSPDQARVEAETVAEQLAAAVAEPVRLGEDTVRMRVSVGVSSFPHDADGFGPLVHLADERMYRLKHPPRPVWFVASERARMKPDAEHDERKDCPMTDSTPWREALRNSHDRLARLLEPLPAELVTGPSYDDGWTVADVASHLGSQAEIFEMFLRAGLEGAPGPGNDEFGPVWDTWNALEPAEQVRRSIASNEGFVRLVEGLSPDQRDTFAMSVFGRDVDLAGLLWFRLGEHAVHTWDVEVALDPAAVVAADAVSLLLDTLPGLAGRAGRPHEDLPDLVVETVSPERRWRLVAAPEVSLTAEEGSGGDPLRLPAEALVRLVYGRLDEHHTPQGVTDPRLPALRAVFPGF